MAAAFNHNRIGAKAAEVHKGMTTQSNGQGGPTNIQAQANNLTDLHKNAMHIKKLNFTGGRQMQSHAT